MRAGRASTTAKLVASWRALANMGLTSVPGFEDRAAKPLLTGRGWQRVLGWMQQKIGDPDWKGRERLRGWVDMIILRVAFIDRAILEADNPQVVILGAGLDTRVWRLDRLADRTVFEVDHPSTQAEKKKNARKLDAPVTEPRYVSVDFERDDLARALSTAGHDPKLPTTWVWEGVVMYLADAALCATLSAVHALSAPGSRLVLHYHEPAARGLGSRLFLRAVGEPQIGQRTRETMQREVEGAGFRITEDAGIVEQAAQVGGEPPSHLRARVSRILIAEPAQGRV